MIPSGLKQAAIEYLAKAFKGEIPTESHIINAAVAIVLTRDPDPINNTGILDTNTGI